MTQDNIQKSTGVVFLKLKEDKEISVDNVTTLQVRNNGVVSVFVNDFEIAGKETFVLVTPDGTQSKIDLSIRFGNNESGELQNSSWNKKELDIIYKKTLKCKN
jgi:hypothetical protein